MDLNILAGMIKNGFDAIDDRFDAVNARFDGVDARFDTVEGRLGKVEHDVADMSSRLRSVERNVEYIHDHMVYQDGFEDLTARVKYLETKMGVDSGK